jgi:hypothetical protein
MEVSSKRRKKIPPVSGEYDSLGPVLSFAFSVKIKQCIDLKIEVKYGK